MNPAPKVAPAGSWRSPIAAEVLASAGLRLAGIALDGERAWWAEGRPAEGGRVVLVRESASGGTEDVLPAPWSARSKVHEYGGGAFAVSDGVAWLVNESDQRVYEWREGKTARALTPDGPWRYADLQPDPARGRLLCVREDHSGGDEPANALVAVDLAGGGVRVLAEGHDFYAAPRVAPDGNRLAFLAWDHPHMPWRGARVWLADVAADGGLGRPRAIAGDGEGASACMPAFAPDGSLWFVAEPDGWWNLHRHADGETRCVCRMPAEFGLPHWVFGRASYAFAADGSVVAAFARDGRWHLGRLRDGTLEQIDTGLTDIVSLALHGERLLLLAGGAERELSVLSLHLDSGRQSVLRGGSTLTLDTGYLDPPESIEFPSGDGERARGLFHPPCNPGFRLADDERPPLLVIGHGGPTGAASPALDPRIRFWTSRGLAVLDLDYRGSTGYGREYRDSLAGRWGVADVDDAVAGARHLADTGRVDGARMAIRGSSAGGYLALAAVTFHDTFAAAVVWYGIGDLEVLARDTHKFESRYLDWLVGPWPERADLYRARSPIHHAEHIACPLLLFQGLDDKVVPPNQAEQVVAAVRDRGGEVEYHAFPGEGHGFRRADTIRTCFERELAFYGRVFGFEPAAD